MSDSQKTLTEFLFEETQIVYDEEAEQILRAVKKWLQQKHGLRTCDKEGNDKDELISKNKLLGELEK